MIPFYVGKLFRESKASENIYTKVRSHLLSYLIYYFFFVEIIEFLVCDVFICYHPFPLVRNWQGEGA